MPELLDGRPDIRSSIQVRELSGGAGWGSVPFGGMETCEDCGFAWEQVADDEVVPRVIDGSAAVAALLRDATDRAGVRPEPGRWSALEYGAHVRDVLLTIRDRSVLGVVEDEPHFSPLYREERVDLGLYAGDTAPAVASEVEAAAAMYARLFAAIGPTDRDRLVHYGWPDPMLRTVRWMGQQAVHEVEHHRTDIEDGLARLAR